MPLASAASAASALTRVLPVHSTMAVIPHTSGEVLYQQENILEYDNRKMQMIFQDPYSCLDPRKTIGQIIAEPLKIHKVVSPSEISQAVLELMDKGGVSWMEGAGSG